MRTAAEWSIMAGLGKPGYRPRYTLEELFALAIAEARAAGYAAGIEDAARAAETQKYHPESTEESCDLQAWFKGEIADAIRALKDGGR